MTDIPVYRLVKKKWRAAAFDGEGAKRHGGRWNSPGAQCVYVSESISLALLEVMVNLQNYRLLADYVVMRLTLKSDAVLQLPDDQLPGDWRADPTPASTAEIGDTWLEDAPSLALAVPSAVVPLEKNYLINPAHSDYEAVVATAEEVDLALDVRLTR